MGWAHSEEICEMYEKIRSSIPQSKRKSVALEIYDMALDLDCDDFDGHSQLEKDAQVDIQEDEL